MPLVTQHRQFIVDVMQLVDVYLIKLPLTEGALYELPKGGNTEDTIRLKSFFNAQQLNFKNQGRIWAN